MWVQKLSKELMIGIVRKHVSRKVLKNVLVIAFSETCVDVCYVSQKKDYLECKMLYASQNEQQNLPNPNKLCVDSYQPPKSLQRSSVYTEQEKKDIDDFWMNELLQFVHETLGEEYKVDHVLAYIRGPLRDHYDIEKNDRSCFFTNATLHHYQQKLSSFFLSIPISIFYVHRHAETTLCNLGFATRVEFKQ